MDNDTSKKRSTSIFGFGTVSQAEGYFDYEFVILCQQYTKKNCRTASNAKISYCYPQAIIDPTVKIGEETVMMANAVINADSRIGRHCIINTGAVIEHDN